MGLTNVQKLLKESLLNLGWNLTSQDEIIVKNDCYLHLNNDACINNPIKSFVYSDKEIQEIINSDYNNMDFKKPRPIKDLLIKLKGAHFYLEKYGWLLLKGKYSSTFNSLTMESLTSDSKPATEFNALIAKINEISERDYVELRGVKQGIKIIHNTEVAYRPVPSSREFGIGSIIQIQKDSYRSNLFKEGALLKIDLILDDDLIVTTLNEKGVSTNRQYKITLKIIREEIQDNNIALVELEQYNELVDCEVWLPFNDFDNSAKLPSELYKYIRSDIQREALMECFKYCLNFSPILNPGLSEGAYNRIIEMLKMNFITENLLTQKFRESSSLILSNYIRMGLDPSQFIDEEYNSFLLEEALKERATMAEEYKSFLGSRDLNPSVIDFLYKYKFKHGIDFPKEIDSNTRWQFLLPYCLTDWFDAHTIEQFESLIKMYASLGEKESYLKVSFLNAELKGAILKYFKCPTEIEYKEKPWTDFILDLLNGDYQIGFSMNGLSIKGPVYSVHRDLNSVYICNLAKEPVWRCVFINEETFINCIDNNVYF